MASVPDDLATDAVLRLKVSEIFHSIQGEADAVGWPTVFVRLTGCPLRCRWCDTAYAFHGGQWLSGEAILRAVRAFTTPRVCVTGGEPLAQRRCHELLTLLCDAGFDVSLETSGALDVSGVDRRVAKVVDLKAPGSGEAGRNRWDNLAVLGPRDQLKIVIGSREDFEWAAELVRTRLPRAVPVLFSPVWGSLPPATLADWILAELLPVRLQVQLHKLLWGEEPGR